jgi:ABC-2 type transport system ATP-binding protein
MYDARHVGRVGGLAVALGVGTAILTGHGVASAAPESEAGTTSTSESASGPTTADATEKSPTEAVDATTADAGAPSQDVSKHPDRVDAESPPAPQRGLVVATGGANTRVTSSGEEPERSTKRPKRPAVVVTTADAAESDAKPAEKAAVETAPAEKAADDPVPSRGSAPVAPAQEAGTALLAAASRRETATTTTDYADVAVKDGVITGDVPVAPPSYYTVVGKPVNGGKVTFEGAGTPQGSTGDFAFLPDASQLTNAGYDEFTLMVSEKSALVGLLEQSPILKPFVKPLVVRLHQIPILGALLSPIIGSAKTYTITIPVADFVGGDPIAFTTKITSFDGTPISVNYFPKIGLASGSEAPTILNGPSLATAGYTDPTQATTVFGLVPGLSVLRGNYNVVTWDPRGEFASGGVLHLDSEDFEAKDVKAIIDWVTTQSSTAFEGTGDDPLIGMVGGSYGGGIQLTAAGIDDRIDAISPGIAWNDLTTTLYPHDAFKTSWASLLLLSLVVSGSRLDSEIYAGILTGAFFGRLTEKQQEFLSMNSPDNVATNIDIPTLFLQGTVDTLFPLQQAMNNALQIEPNGAPVKMIWYCGGHGQCLDPVDLDQQTDYTVGEIMNWMDTYVMNKGIPAPPSDDPKFSWVDQDGNWWGSDELPIDPGFYGARYTVPGSTGGLLPIVPILGGSGPQWQAKFPVSLVSGAKVGLGALNLHVASPGPDPTYVVGAPQVTLTYSGLGTSRDVYAQLVDDQTGRVLGNIVSPIPVILDGKEHTTLPIDMEAIAYTMNPGDSVTLQIFDSATSFEDFSSFGVVNVKSVGLSLPTAAHVTELEMADAAAAPR